MDKLMTPEILALLNGIDLSNPATLKTALIAALVLAATAIGKLAAQLLLKGLALLAKKTRTTADDEIIAAAQKDLEKK